MKREFFQIVVKYLYSNKISVYNFYRVEVFKETLNELKANANCIILTTNIASEINQI